MSDFYLKNVDNAPVGVYHRNLRRWFEESLYKSVCPFCPDGILLIHRDQNTFRLQELDGCIFCGQKVLYLDIEELRAREATATETTVDPSTET